MNITEPFAHHARAAPDKAAIVHGERTITYRELDPLVSRAGAWLYSLGLAPGDVVGVALKDSPEHLVLLAGLDHLRSLGAEHLVGTHGPADQRLDAEQARRLCTGTAGAVAA